ncbi:anthranilate synthase family protein [Nocardia sp. NPDC020380]|uniref:anthranilate synthase family protein n=1 Tax=Nocardia sp. NPDC020380 TaxID=3364309 RepID=UPI0037A6D26E
MNATSAVLREILRPDPPPFALLYRRTGPAGPGIVEVRTGDIVHLERLADLRAHTCGDPDTAADLVVAVPYRQLAERGYPCHDDGAPLLALRVRGETTVAIDEFATLVPDRPTRLRDAGFDMDDEAYAARAERIISEAIGAGDGANFVLKRTFRATIPEYRPLDALVVFSRLLAAEPSSYWTFVLYTGERTLLGASPERHLSVRDGRAVMNPISGTYRYPEGGPTLPGITAFLGDRKETDELFMVVDEELKMMARICDADIRVHGPYLKPMSHLAHTEYIIEGRTSGTVPDLLRETMFAPTVTGSPVQRATEVIYRHEPEGRGYYSGVVGLIGQDDSGANLDSAITIRTADIDAAGRLRIDVGATIVRHSDPQAEARETRVKAAGLLAAMTHDQAVSWQHHPQVVETLARRNDSISGFWLGRSGGDCGSPLGGLRVLIVDAEDTFTAMLAHQLRALGAVVLVCRIDEVWRADQHDLVVMGPGPGDPRSSEDARISRLRASVDGLFAARRPFLAICLSHQIVCRRLGLELVRREVPNQGVQRRIELFGRPETVGFYNTFAARHGADKVEVDGVGIVEICRDPATGQVHATRAERFASLQFHPESLLTVDGPRITATLIEEVMQR